MTPDAHAQALHSRFTWESDGKLDSWHYMAPDGPVRGDCDDYAVTLLRLIAGSWPRFWWWLLTFRAVFWFVRDPNGASHLTLWLRGHGYSDNWRDHFAKVEELHSKRLPALLPVVVLKMLIGKIDKT